MQRNNEIVIFETEDNQVRLPVTVEDETCLLYTSPSPRDTR